MKKIKILYVVVNLKRCGPINILYNLIKYIDKNIYEIYIVSLSPQCNNSREEEFKNLGCNIYNLNLSKIKSLLFSRNRIKKILKDDNIDILHSHGLRPDIVISKIKNCKKVSTLHNFPDYDYKMSYGSIIGTIASIYHKNILKKIDIVCGCSKFVKNAMLDQGIKIDFVQNGVDKNEFIPSSDKEKIELRKKLSLPLYDKIFIVVGNINYRKNPSIIIDSFNSRRISNEKVVFLGTGDLYQKSINQAKENPNIIFKGNVNNVNEYLNASDYYISSSLAEGLPNSVLEAMSCGLPCILSKIKPHEEILENKKQLFNPNNKEELLKAIDYIINQDYQTLKKNSRKTIENKLSANIMAYNYSIKYIAILKS